MTPSSDTNSVTTMRAIPPLLSGSSTTGGTTIQAASLSSRSLNIAPDQLSATFAALADPTRRAILARLVDGEATVNEIAEPFPITLQAVSQHLRVLERAGLIERGRTAQLRPSRLRGAALKDATEWLERYRGFWEQSFDALERRLETDEDESRDG
jgi:DNA-binding transcriptional ArsR family regulator